jgi:hypothetical protein
MPKKYLRNWNWSKCSFILYFTGTLTAAVSAFPDLYVMVLIEIKRIKDVRMLEFKTSIDGVGTGTDTGAGSGAGSVFVVVWDPSRSLTRQPMDKLKL